MIDADSVARLKSFIKVLRIYGKYRFLQDVEPPTGELFPAQQETSIE